MSDIKDRIAEVYKKDQRAVRAVLMEIVTDHEDVDELVMDTFVRALEKCEYFDEEKSSLLTWVCNVGKGVAKNWLRDLDTDPDLVLESSLSLMGEEGVLSYDELYAAADPSDRADLQTEAVDLYRAALEQMPFQMASCVDLRRIGHSNREIADILGTSIDVVYTQINRSRQYFE